MIVICSSCQARFRVADEKVGPRGAKVRCSRCQTVFVVRREPAQPAPPAHFDIELTPGPARPAPPADPFSAGPQPAPVPAFPSGMAPAPETRPATDPFAAAGLDAFGDPAPSPDDPFALAGAGLASAAFPEPGGPLSDPDAGTGPGGDPFARQALGDPFGELELPGAPPAGSSLPVTDLSQLLGLETSAPPHAAPPPAPALQKDLDLAAGLALGADLALEERSAPIPAPSFADPSDVFLSGGLDPGAFGGAAFEDGPQAMAPVGEESLSLATERTPAPEEPAPPAAAPPPEPRPPRPVPQAAAAAEAEAEVVRLSPPLTFAQRLRSAAVGALALIALIVFALAFRVVWRGDVPLGPAMFRPSNLLRALGHAPEVTGAFEVAAVRSGVYEQAGGGAVLFVRGEVISRAQAPVAAVRVAAELVRDGQVLARGEALAGALPTPEEVHGAVDRAALDALAAVAQDRAPRSIAPGQRVGFLVLLGDAPSDVSGASVRVRTEAGEAPR